MINHQFRFVALASLCLFASGCTAEKKQATMGELPRDEQLHAYVMEMREDVSAGKVRLFNEVMELTPAEAQVFWPLYTEYEKELYALNDRRVDVIHHLNLIQNNGGLTNDDASKLGAEYFTYQSSRMALLQKYYDLMHKQLSPIRAAQFAQIEHRVNTMIDLLIASELPMVRGQTSR